MWIIFSDKGAAEAMAARDRQKRTPDMSAAEGDLPTRVNVVSIAKKIHGALANNERGLYLATYSFRTSKNKLL